ncbi:MAG: hypothetical protein DRN13_03580 [Thermoplasmata archaeon]|nr:MAG: hypothetical protein DRN13_03580 [Thermoplasmata archaeon]
MRVWREIRFPVSLLSLIIGILFFLSGIVWLFLKKYNIPLLTDLSNCFKEWNYYLLIIGLILSPIGGWYSYDYIKKRRYLIEEIKTGRKSELARKRGELEKLVKSMPRKYEEMLRNKEEELGLR